MAEAPYGNLQGYIDTRYATLTAFDCARMCEQAADAIAHIHGKGVVHADMRPENFLVYGVEGTCPLIWLCDFGGSCCSELGLDGMHLPDTPFDDPRRRSQSEAAVAPATDIFSLGGIFYTIQTGHWPYLHGPPKGVDDLDWIFKVDAMISAGEFPDLTGIRGSGVIQGCWDHRFKTAEEVLSAIRSEMIF
jgi:serine/threonine protein kinase